MKRVCCLLLLLLLCLVCLPAPASEANIGFFTRDEYIRSEQVPHGSRLEKIPAYTVVEYDPDGKTGYGRASFNGVEGWLYLYGIQELPKERELEPFTVYSLENMTLRSLPYDDAARSDVLKANSVMTVTGESLYYWHVVCGDIEGYVIKSRVQSTDSLRVREIDPLEMYIPIGTVLTDMPLYCSAALSTVESYSVHIIRRACGNWYYVDEGPLKGWVEKSLVTASRMAQGEDMQLTAALALNATELLTEDGNRRPVPEGTPLFVTANVGSLWGCTCQSMQGYLPKSDVRLIWNEAPLDGYRLEAPEELSLLDFPDASLGKVTGTVPAGTEIFVSAAIRNYLKVSTAEQTGYVAARASLLAEETTEMPLTEDIPRYRLMLDRTTRMAYAFLLDDSGALTDQTAVYAKVAIGKSTTPTPSGTYPLGKKSRWHKYTHSYTPYCTAYSGARFIHGLPTSERDDHSVIAYLSHNAGQAVTGGCLRSPTAFARWVYLNCPSYLTELVIVKGGLAVPAVLTGTDFSD